MQTSATRHGRQGHSRVRVPRGRKPLRGAGRRGVADLQSEVVRHLREELRKRQLDYAQFAALLAKHAPELKPSASKVSRWFSPSREKRIFQEMGLRELGAIAKVLNIPVGDLIYGKDPKRHRPADSFDSITNDEAIIALVRNRGWDIVRSDPQQGKH